MGDTPADPDAVRASYDEVAAGYVAMGMGRRGSEPWLQAALSAFAEEVRGVGPLPGAGAGAGGSAPDSRRTVS
jgi:hypothetical protein